MTFIIEICWSITVDKKFFGLLYKIFSIMWHVINYINLSSFESETFLVSYIIQYGSILLSINLHTRIVRFLATVEHFTFLVKKLITCFLNLFTELTFF